jgi:hypothetical protein
VNVYLPKSLITRIDRHAAEMGMSRSSFFGFAATLALEWKLPPPSLVPPRSRVHKTGALRAERRSGKKPKR